MVTAALLVTIHDLQNGWPEACQHWSKIALFGSASPHRKGSALEESDSRASYASRFPNLVVTRSLRYRQ
jgi:hypothetical protein